MIRIYLITLALLMSVARAQESNAQTDLLSGTADSIYDGNNDWPEPSDEIPDTGGTEVMNEATDETDTKRETLVPEITSPRILLARPMYAPYGNESKTMWIAAAIEGILHLRLRGMKTATVIGAEQIAHQIPYYRDFSRRISRQAWIDAGNSLKATHLVYHEYEPVAGGKKVKYVIDLYSLTENRKIFTAAREFAFEEMEPVLNKIVSGLHAVILPDDSSSFQDFLAVDLAGTNSKILEQAGRNVSEYRDSDKQRSAALLRDLDKLSAQYPNNHLITFLTSTMHTRAQAYESALPYQRKLTESLALHCPSLKIDLARLYRFDGKHRMALQVLEADELSGSYAAEFSEERARAYEASGEYDKALEEVQRGIGHENGSGDLYIQMAVLTIRTSKQTDVTELLSRATASGYVITGDDYYRLATSYASTNRDNEAREMLLECLHLRPDHENAWQQLAGIYEKFSQDSMAAECFVHLFHLNNQAYHDYLWKAGTLFEKSNQTVKAGETYALFLDRKFYNPQVSLALARMKYEAGDCRQVTRILASLDTVMAIKETVADLLDKCGESEQRNPKTQSAPAPRKARLSGRAILRISSGALALGGVAVAIWSERRLGTMQGDYNAAGSRAASESLHTSMDQVSLMRTLSYALCVTASAGLSLTFFFPSSAK